MQAALIEPVPQAALTHRERPPRGRVKASVEVRHIVFFLNDALDEYLLARMERTPKKVTLAETVTVLCRFKGSGALAYPWNAKSVEDALRARSGEDYRLLGARVLPNHVHVLIEAGPAWPSRDPIHRWKMASSPLRKGTPRPGLERFGPDRLRPRALRLEQPRPDEFWADEDFERILRTPEELEDARRLIDEITPPSPPPPPEPEDGEAPASDTPLPAEPEDDLEAPAVDVPPPSAVTRQSRRIGRRASVRTRQRGRLGRWLKEAGECVRDLAVLYGAFFFAVWIVALVQEALGRLAHHR